MIQGINPSFIFGKRHLFEVIKIILESKKRKINIVKRLEMEILMRLVCSNQVDKAIDIGGLKNNCPGCFVLLSEKKDEIIETLKYLLKYLRINLVAQNNSLLSASKEKMIYICERLEIPCGNFNRTEFLKILTEKAALVSLR
jgi:tRNA threonylcarbamoyladenosine modification (KEOPS) complex Cgi121 subunit